MRSVCVCMCSNVDTCLHDYVHLALAIICFTSRSACC